MKPDQAIDLTREVVETKQEEEEVGMLTKIGAERGE